MSYRDDTRSKRFPERDRLPSYVDGVKQHYYPTVEHLVDPTYHTTSYELNFPKPHRFIKEDIQATRILGTGIECQVVNGLQPDSSNYYYLNSSKTNSGVSLIYSPNHNIEKFNFHEAEVIPGIAAIYLEAGNNSSNAQVTIPERILRNTLYVSSISIESERTYPTSSYEPDLRPRLILIPGGIEISRLSKEDATQLTKTQKENNIIVNQERFTYVIRPINFDENPIVLPERFTGFNIAAYQPIEGIAATRLNSSLYAMPGHSWLRYNSRGSLVIDNCREEKRSEGKTIWQHFKNIDSIVIGEPLLLEILSDKTSNELKYNGDFARYRLCDEALFRNYIKEKYWETTPNKKFLFPAGTILRKIDLSKESPDAALQNNPDSILIFDESAKLGLALKIPVDRKVVEIPHTNF